jgi:para-aminobenzoate synthetase component 1
MIVDLMRNDLSRVCLPGSVETPVLCGLESYAAVHHLVSVVRGRLRPGMDALHLFAACFPAGRSPARQRFGRWKSSTNWSRGARGLLRVDRAFRL